jgi:large subunit ribosomal protein L1
MAEAKKPAVKKAAVKVKKTATKKTVKAVKPLAVKPVITADPEENSSVAEPIQTETILETSESIVETEVSDKTTKAGRRSSKAQREAQVEAERQERKQHTETESVKPKVISKPTRTKLERRGKKFRELAKLIEVSKLYDVAEAVALAQKSSPVSFDATFEMHVNLNVDPRHADQNIRDNLVLPAGTGKKVRIAVLSADSEAALKAGADIAGNEDLLAQLEKGTFNFDILIATPNLMPKLGKYARTLGPRGLMPNPKSGTVTNDVAKAVNDAKAGRVEYRVDSTGIVHLGVGKVSFTTDQLRQNVEAVLTSIKANKPASVKSGYLKAIYVTTTMGPSVPVNIATLN